MIAQLSVITFLVSFGIVIIYFSPTNVEIQTGISNNNTKSNISKSSSRSKRFLIFQGSGTAKMVIGLSNPVNLMSRFPNRQLALNYALHLQYSVPTAPTYWWTYFINNTAWAHTSAATGRQRRPKKLMLSPKSHKHSCYHNPHLKHHGTFVQRHYQELAVAYDVSRSAIYKAVEAAFNSKGFPGERCLLRTICEISQQPLYEDNAIHGIINTIFSPSVLNIDKKYLRAKQIGVQGMNCEKIYWSCTKGVKWLKRMSYYV